MELTDTERLYAAVVFGAAIVAISAWSRFDQPSYDDKSQYFRIYAPRFATPGRAYWYARLGYVAVLLGIFLLFSFVPGLLEAVLGDPALTSLVEKLNGTGTPLFFATLLLGAQQIQGLKQAEMWVRTVLHALGKIPHAVRLTVNQMKSASFQFADYGATLRRECVRLRSAAKDTRLDRDLAAHDLVLRDWLQICCLVDRFNDRELRPDFIKDSFYAAYEEELEQIAMRRDALAAAVGGYAAALAPGLPTDADAPDRETASAADSLPGFEDLKRDLKNLRGRLYTFIACGLRCSLASEAIVASRLMSLGFDVRPTPAPRQEIGRLALRFLLCVLVMTVLTTALGHLFNSHFVDPSWPGELKGQIIPQESFQLTLWTFHSAAYYLAAAAGALLVRALALAQLRWSDLEEPERRRPFHRYVGPMVAGVLPAYLVLSGGFVLIFALPEPITLAGLVQAQLGAMKGAFPWLPLAAAMAFAMLWVSDAELAGADHRRIVGTTLALALSIGAMGALIAGVGADQFLAQQKQAQIQLPPGFERALWWSVPLKALLICLLSGLLILLVQLQERKAQAKVRQKLIGTWLTLLGSQGASCDLLLTGEEQVLRSGGAGGTQAVGRWLQFPEGYVIYSSSGLRIGRQLLRGHGILRREGSTVLFEACPDALSPDSEFLAQVVVRPPDPEPAAPRPVAVPLRAVGS